MDLIRSILDPESFTERRALVRSRVLGGSGEASDGVVTGCGLVSGSLVYVIAQDPSVLGGSVGAAHARKIGKIYREAAAVHAPVLEILAGSGIRLDEAGPAMLALGEALQMKAALKGTVPMVTLIAGTCGGILAALAASSDFIAMTENASYYMTPPEAVLGNRDEDLASAASRGADGKADFTGNAAEACAWVRELITFLPPDGRGLLEYTPAQDPLNRAAEGFFTADAAASVRLMADDSVLLETKQNTESGMLTGLIRVNGQAAGVIANSDSVLSAAGMEEAADMLQFCSDFRLPVITVADAAGFRRDQEEESLSAPAAAKLVQAYVQDSAPKVTFVKRACGTAGRIMGSAELGADLVLAFPDSDLTVLDSRAAGDILAQEDSPEARRQAADAFQKRENSLEAAAGDGRVDSVIQPEEARQQAAAALEILFQKTASAK